MDVSYLYTPALRVDSLITHEQLQPHMVVVDLEDSTHVNAKEAARAKIASFDFTPLRDRGIKLGVRINAVSTYDGVQDLLLMRTIFGRPDAAFSHVFLPKVGHLNEVRIYRSLFATLPSVPRLYSFIETVDAVDQADGIASASDALCFGQADLVAEMYSPNDAFINYARARLCVAAAKYNIQAIDTNSFDIKNMAKFEEECVMARGYGFTGKAAIHPDHIPIVNRIFAVPDDLVAKYESSIDAYMAADTGFLIKDGEVMAPPFIAKARRMLGFYKKHTS
jgi:citrate lyase subunit beta/citryl-CoA lyase/(S)-citramalyl-CoA lyase